ncbi:hypothetical protein B0H16DRAFT_1718272 [Mycena metata]|uniref:F-box domain-containing protein n=1 Tax=Mycena metata TaxID=1033252 RepID=A0AAD7JIV0_9AGAR|nr:hypothetical protein B0H16DRAFT_1718272 [Mycena metata]
MCLLPIGGQRRKSAAKGAITVPLELQFLILDQLTDDDLELRKLCTVCKAWANHVQEIMFRHIWVTSATRPRLVRRFLHKPQLGKYVQVVTVVGSTSFGSTEQLFMWLSDVMPNLQTLDLLRCAFEDDIFPLQQSVLPKVTYLRLRSSEFRSADTLLQLILLFPRLEGLDLSGHYTAPGRALAPPTSSLRAPGRLRYLTCDATRHAFLLRWLALGSVIVDELFIPTGWGDNHDELKDVLLKLGDGLKCLRLTGVEPRNWPSDSLLAIPPFPLLQSLEVDLHLLSSLAFGWDATQAAFKLEDGLLLLLKQLLSPALSTIYLDTLVTPAHLDIPWAKLDSALARFSALEEVIFDLYGFFDLNGGTRCRNMELPSYADLCCGMRKAMPLSEARGILKFRCAGKGSSPKPRLLRDVFC